LIKHHSPEVNFNADGHSIKSAEPFIRKNSDGLNETDKNVFATKDKDYQMNKTMEL
jgi:hypothetical protein